MVFNLSLSPKLEERLRQEAERRGLSVDALTIEILDEHLRQNRRVAADAVRRHDAFLNSYAAEDEGLYDDIAG